MLLPPPDPKDSQGEYELGSVIYDNREIGKFGLREKEFLRHLGLFGITGTGKSNVVFKLIDELIRHGKHVFVFDWKRQYRDILTYKSDLDILIFGVGNKEIPTIEFNPLIPPPGLDPHQYLEHTCQIVASAYYCGEGVISLLRNAISFLYEEYGVYAGNATKYPTFQDVLTHISDIEKKGRSRDWWESTKRSLEAICHGGIGDIVNVQKPTLQLDELLNKNVFLELGDLSQSQKSFIIQSLLTYLYYYSMNRGVREKLMNVIVIEEAHHILRDHSHTTVKEPITDIILKEIREFGTGIIIIDQNPSLISVPALANNYCTIGMYTKHAADISALSKAMFLDESQKECLGKLECGHGIVKLAGRIFTPFLVRFPLMNIKKGVILNLEIDLRMRKKGFQSKWMQEFLKYNPGFFDDTPDISEKSHDSFENQTEFQDNPQDLRKSQDNSGQQRRSHGIYQNSQYFQNIVIVDEIPNAERIDGFSADSKKSQGYSGQWRKIRDNPENDEIENEQDFGKKIDVLASERAQIEPAKFGPDSDLTNSILKDIRAYPFDGINSRTKRLCVSNRKCHEAIAMLLKQEIIRKIEILEKSGRRILFEIKDDSRMKGGIEHRYWNFQIGEINKSEGYKVELEKHIEGDGFIDQVITKENEIIAVEIETGKSHPIETIKRDLGLGFSKVICVATSQKAYDSISDKVSLENFPLDKISVVLASNYA